MSVKPVDTASRSKQNNNITRFPFQDKFWKYNSNHLPAAMIIVINVILNHLRVASHTDLNIFEVC